MAYKHPLVPNIKNSQSVKYNFTEENNICGTCNLPDKFCSHNCKRYKEELAKLKAEKSNGSSDVGSN